MADPCGEGRGDGFGENRGCCGHVCGRFARHEQTLFVLDSLQRLEGGLDHGGGDVGLVVAVHHLWGCGRGFRGE